MITMDRILANTKAPFELCEAFTKTMEEITPHKVLVLYRDERLDGALCALLIAGNEDELDFGTVTIVTYKTVQSPSVQSFIETKAVIRYETEEGVAYQEVLIEGTSLSLI
jgi:hypothetical protein